MILQQEKIMPPYILVGHSFGGLYMLLYAQIYPQEVSGLLLLDASTSTGPTPLPTSIATLKRLGNPQNPIPEDPLYNELIGQLPSYLQAQQAPHLLRSMPLVIMYATKHCLPAQWIDGQLMCMTAKEEQQHLQEQLVIYNMSNIHRLIQVNGDHNSFFTPNQNTIPNPS